MYKNYEKVNKLLKEALLLKDTDCEFKDIYDLTINRNRNNIVAIYVDESGKIKKYKYNEFARNVNRFANVIDNKLKEFPKDNVVGLKVSNNPHWGEAFYAILMAGYKPLLIDAKNNAQNTENLLKQSKAVAIVSNDIHHYEEKKITLTNLLDAEVVQDFKGTWANEMILCSSGTTGDVKLMVFNGENMSNQIMASLQMGEQTGDIMYPGKIFNLAMIPFHHIFGFVAVFLWYTFYGKTLVYPASATPNDIQYICQKVGITHVYSVPLFWDSLALGLKRKIAMLGEKKEKILNDMIAYNVGEMDKKEAGIAASNIAKNKIQKSLLGNKVKYCISGGGFLSYETLKTMNGIGYNLYDGYGMTELGVTSVELSSDVKQRLKGHIGQPLNGVSYKIKDNGELYVKSKITHIREIIGGKESKVALDEEGYFSTGDIAEKDENNSYTLKGRIKDIIVNADGENIFPDELEIYFKDLEHVVHLCVLGIAKKGTHDEDVDIVLELDNSASNEDLEALKNKILSTVLPHKVAIKDIYISRKKLPLANNMKVKRLTIKKSIEAGEDEYFLLGAKRKERTLEGLDPKEVEEILPKVKKIFAKILILPEFKVENDSHWINDLGGDSMSYVELIKECQDEFHIVFPDESLTGSLTCVNDFVYEIIRLKKEQNK